MWSQQDPVGKELNPELILLHGSIQGGINSQVNASDGTLDE